MHVNYAKNNYKNILLPGNTLADTLTVRGDSSQSTQAGCILLPGFMGQFSIMERCNNIYRDAIHEMAYRDCLIK